MSINGFPAQTGLDLTKFVKTESLNVASTTLTTGVPIDLFDLSGFKGKIEALSIRCYSDTASGLETRLEITLDDNVLFHGALNYSSTSQVLMQYWLILPQMLGDDNNTVALLRPLASGATLWSGYNPSAIVAPKNVVDESIQNVDYTTSPDVTALWLNNDYSFTFRNNIKFRVKKHSGGGACTVSAAIVYSKE